MVRLGNRVSPGGDLDQTGLFVGNASAELVPLFQRRLQPVFQNGSLASRLVERLGLLGQLRLLSGLDGFERSHCLLAFGNGGVETLDRRQLPRDLGVQVGDRPVLLLGFGAQLSCTLLGTAQFPVECLPALLQPLDLGLHSADPARRPGIA